MKDKIDTFIDESFLRFPDAKHIAVQNFCWTSDKNSINNYFNIQRDADLYNWNMDTIKAIEYVLRKMLE